MLTGRYYYNILYIQSSSKSVRQKVHIKLSITCYLYMSHSQIICNSKTPIYCAPIYRDPRFTGPNSFPLRGPVNRGFTVYGSVESI